MSHAFRSRCIAVAIVASALVAIPTVDADAIATAYPTHPDGDTTCFLLPVRAGEAKSDEFCVKAPRGTPRDQLLAGAPTEFQTTFTSSSSILLGTDYQDNYLTGPTFTWTGAGTCSSSVNYVGDYTPEWKNIVSSAQLSSGAGCTWFYHFDGDSETGDYTYCGVVTHPCDGTWMTIYGMNDRSNSVRFSNF